MRDHPIGQPAIFPTRLVLENDADAVATDFLLTVRSVDLFKGDEERQRCALRNLFILVGALFAVMDQTPSSHAGYPPPLHRFFNVLDHAAPSAEKELEIPYEVTRSCAKEAVLELQLAAHVLELPAGRWRQPTANEWQVDHYESQKVVWRSEMNRLLGGRSTISDAVMARIRP